MKYSRDIVIMWLPNEVRFSTFRFRAMLQRCKNGLANTRLKDSVVTIRTDTIKAFSVADTSCCVSILSVIKVM